MSLRDVARRVLALREVTRVSGMITRRAQSVLMEKLTDEQLAELAVLISKTEREKANENRSNNIK